jgi:phosphoribosylformylglycinamidine cyclo-ligase
MQVTYKGSGVDIAKADRIKEEMKGIIQSTFNRNVALGSGAFGGAFDAGELKKMKTPVLISSVDGVGTKTKIASAMNKWDTIGIDIVNHSANDIVCIGAKPLFFFDYIAAAELKQEIILDVVKGLSAACRELDMPLVAGETAEMPGVYEKGELDLAGSIVGVVEKSEIIDGRKIRKGDVLIGLPSEGLNTNGYSLARKVFFETAGKKVSDFMPELGRTVGEALLVPHKNYSKTVLAILKKFDLHGIAHITGGSFYKNIGRLLPKGCGAKINKGAWNPLPVFKAIQSLGGVPEEDMYHAFNMGIGMVLIANKKDAKKIEKELLKLGEKAVEIGGIVSGSGVEIL